MACSAELVALIFPFASFPRRHFLPVTFFLKRMAWHCGVLYEHTSPRQYLALNVLILSRKPCRNGLWTSLCSYLAAYRLFFLLAVSILQKGHRDSIGAWMALLCMESK